MALNAERVEEERRGIIRWLRPEFQNPAGAKSEQQTTMGGIEVEEKEVEAKPIAALERMAVRDGRSVDAVLARELRDFVSGESHWLVLEMPGLAEAFAWPEPAY